MLIRAQRDMNVVDEASNLLELLYAIKGNSTARRIQLRRGVFVESQWFTTGSRVHQVGSISDLSFL